MKYYIKGNKDALSHNPYWVAVIFPFAITDTYTKSDQETDNPVATKKAIILEDEILNWSISGGKESFTGAAQFALDASSPVDSFESEDWMVFWVFDNYKDYEYTKENLFKMVNKESFGILNAFDKAPKFFGQIQGINRNENINQNGAINVSYLITAHSFTPFAGSQWFDPTLEQYTKQASTWWSNFSTFKALSDSPQAGVIASQTALSSLLNIMLATGPDNLIFSQGPGRPVSPNQKYLVPEEIVKVFRSADNSSSFNTTLLNISSTTNQNLTFIDLIDSWIGVQKYNRGGDENGNDIPGIFIPNNLNETPLNGTQTVYETNDPIEGQMPLQPLNFSNQQTWSILDSYLNKPLNEMYTCMKVNKDKRVVPVFIARQMPLALRKGFEEKVNDINEETRPRQFLGDIDPKTGKQDFSMDNIFNFGKQYDDLFSDKIVTYFDELPDWDIDSQYLISASITKTGAARTNFVSLTPFNGLKNESARNSLNANLSLPVIDNIDIKRNGLRPIIGNIPSAWLDDLDTTLQKRNGYANQLMASVTFNGHLKLSGQITLLGIQLPIQHGDNVTIDGITYHIERCGHQGAIQPDGRKTFMTMLNVSHGVKLASDGSGDHEFAKLGINRHTVSKE